MRFTLTDNGYEVSVYCPICKEEKPLSHIFSADELQKLSKYLEYRNGYIQDALSFLSASDREQILSGVCADCYKMMSGEDEEAE